MHRVNAILLGIMEKSKVRFEIFKRANWTRFCHVHHVETQTLNCLMCGAPTRTGTPNCEHCGARLATVACPGCFGMIFQGSRYCPHCGTRADRAEQAAQEALLCPKCQHAMALVRVGETALTECQKCHGLWVDNATFEQICRSREHQVGILGGAQRALTPKNDLEKVRYVPCPHCRTLMHRINFAKCSGVVVDVCKSHGTWFDREELQHIVLFIQSGGLTRARDMERSELEQARRRLEASRREAALDNLMRPTSIYYGSPLELDLISMAGSVLTDWF